MATLRLNIDPSGAVRGADIAESALERVSMQAAQTTAATQRVGGGFNNMRGGIQNASYQIADVAVQMGYGVSAMRAMSIQLPQLLAGFGVWGAVAGAVAAVTSGILGASTSTQKFAFDWSQLAADMGDSLAPITAVWGAIKSAWQVFVEVMIEGANRIINGFQLIVAVVRAVPDVFASAMRKASLHLNALGEDATAISFEVQAAFQRMWDAITPGAAAGAFMPDLGEGEGATAAENLSWLAGAARNRAENLRGIASDATGAFATLGDAISNVTAIDIRDYFRSAADAAAGEEGSLSDAVDEITKKLQSLADSIQSSMEDGFMAMIDGTKSAKEAFRDMARSIIAELYRVLVVQQLVGSFDAATGTGSGIMGFLGPILGGVTGMRASGGSVMAGESYIVGERGPEIFTPSSQGAITPNGGGGSVVVNQTVNIQGLDSDIEAKLMKATPRIVEAAKAGVLDGVRRGGSYGRAFR